MAEHNCVAVTATLLLLFVTLVRSQEDGGCRRISQYLDDMYIKCQAPPDPDKLYMDADLDPIPGGAQWLIRVPDNGPDQGYEIHKIGVAWRHLCRNGHVNSTLPAEGEYTLIASVYHRNAKPIKVSLPVNITLEDRLSATQGYSGSENAALNYISEDFIPFTAHEHEIIQVSISFVNHKNESIAVLNEGNACPECVELSYRVYRVGCDFPNNFDCLSAYFRWKKDLETSPEYCFPPYVITNLAGMYDRCFVPPTITYVSPNVNVFLFESATLVCLSEGSPDPDIRWYREGKQETISYNNYLHVNRVTWNNRGRYVCEAENMVGKVNTTRPITLGIFDRTCNNYKVKEDDFLETCSSNGRYEPSEISDWPEVIATSADATLTDIEIDNALFHREPEYEADDDPDCEPHLGRGKLVSFTVNIFDLTEVPEDETTGSPDIPSTVVTKEMLSITVDSSSMRTTDATTTIMEHDSADMTQEMTNSDPKPLDNSAIMDVTEEQYMHIPTNPKHAPVGYTRPPSTRSVRNRQKNDDEHDDDDDDNSEKNSQGNRRNLMNPGNRATDTSTQSRQRDFSPGGVPQTIREITSHSPTSTIQTAASRPGISEKLILSKTFSNVYSVAPDPLCMKKTETLKVSIVSEGVDVLRGHRLRVEILDSDGNLLERRCEGETCTALWYRSFQTDCNTTTNGQCLSAYFQWKNILSNVRGKKCARARNFDRKFEPCTRVVLPRAHLTVDGTYRVSTKDHRRLRCQVSGDPTPRVQWLSNSSPLENSAQDNTYNFSRSQAGNYTLECQASNMFDTIKSNPVTLTVFEWKEAFCLEELAGGLTWPRTAEGQQALSTEKCPAHREFRGLAKATRNCLANLNGASWGPVEKQKCGRKVNINTELQHLTEVEITENNVETVATQLSDLTTGYANFTSTGVTDTADVLVNIVAHTNSSLVSKEIVNSLSNLMQVDQATLGESQETAKASQKTIMALESYLEKVELKGNQTVLQAVDEQIGIEVIQDEPVAFQDGIGFVSMVDTQGNDGDEIGDLSVQKMPDNVVKMDNRTDASIMIPPSVLNYTDDNSDKVRFTFVIYKTAALFQSSSLSVISDDNREVTKIVNSRIIAGSLATGQKQS
ncbi:uncharacterized protein [Ptychodera flava]|uniref:uncharacterized protein n=1 Tax=Ptychodera flava TaxID=63121 RepID=UPI003969D56B